MSVTVDGARRYNWAVSTGTRGGPPSGVYQPQRFERSWYSRKFGRAPMPHSLDLLPRRLRHPRHHACVAAQLARLAWLRAPASIQRRRIVCDREERRRRPHAHRGHALNQIPPEARTSPINAAELRICGCVEPLGAGRRRYFCYR
ncbi:MAG: hypothetical protein WAU53_11100 [Rhodoplanes sp.]